MGFDQIKKNNSLNLLNKLKIPENFILYVGSRYRYKNFNLLINSFCLTKKVVDNYNIVCFGGEDFSVSEKKKLEELNINEKIFHIKGKDDLLAYLYSKAKLFVFPSIYEGFGIPLIEAMSIGCPVLASNTDIFKEICKEGVHYFENNDQNSLSYQLETLLNSDKELLSKKNLALNISKKYSWKKCADETYEIYKKL